MRIAIGNGKIRNINLVFPLLMGQGSELSSTGHGISVEDLHRHGIVLSATASVYI